jgi:hypothetical protein
MDLANPQSNKWQVIAIGLNWICKSYGTQVDHYAKDVVRYKNELGRLLIRNSNLRRRNANDEGNGSEEMFLTESEVELCDRDCGVNCQRHKIFNEDYNDLLLNTTIIKEDIQARNVRFY